MKTLPKILIGLFILWCSACETIIEVNELSDENVEKLVINGIVTPDSLLTIFVGYSYSSQDAPIIVPRDYGERYNLRGCWGPHHWIDYPKDGYYDDLYSPNKGYGCRYAKVKVVVNDDTEYEMKYNEKTYRYHSSYRPAVGDRIKVTAVDDFGKTASVETKVLSPQKLEILDYKKETRTPVPESNGNPSPVLPPSEVVKIDGKEVHLKSEVVHLKIRITDPGEEENYYRLRVRNGYLQHTKVDGVECDRWSFNDVFKSEDLLFRDSRLTRGWGGWSACFSDVFDDHLINGKEYLVELDSWLTTSNRKLDEYFVVELQSIPKDFYHYLKAVYKYRVTMDTDYGEAIYIPTNVENGWGMLGSCCGEKHIIEL